MSAAGAPAAGGVPAGRLGLALVLHINRQTEKLGLPPLEILKRMSPDRRLSLFQSVVMEALQIDHVPQLRQDSGKRAALVSLVSLVHFFDDQDHLQDAGFDESGELHLYVDKGCSSAQQQAAAGKLSQLDSSFQAAECSPDVGNLPLLQAVAASGAAAAHLPAHLA